MGTFTKRFGDEQELAILSMFYTAPKQDVSVIRAGSAMGPEELAAINAGYSRSHLSHQVRFLRLLEKEKNLDMDFVDAVVRDPSLALLNPLVGSKVGKFTSSFHNRWSLGLTEEDKDTAIRGFGDGSIRDAAIITYHAENFPDLIGKDITRNPQGKPQVKSTRYLDWKMAELSSDEIREGDERSIDDLIAAVEANPDINESRYAGEIHAFHREIFGLYEEATDRCAEFVANREMNLRFKEEYLSDEAVTVAVDKYVAMREERDSGFEMTATERAEKMSSIRKRRERTWPLYSRKSVFDATRYLLTASIPTSLANVADTNAMYADINRLLSSPFEVARNLGRNIRGEAAKVAPTLYGPNAHIGNDYQVRLREELRTFAKEKFSFEKDRDYTDHGRVHLPSMEMFTDAQIFACVAYPHCFGSLEQIYGHLVENPRDVESLRDIVASERGKFDPLPEESLHGGHIVETAIDQGADRDLQRHRRGPKSEQLLTMFLGYEIPPLIEMAGLGEKYHAIMGKAEGLYRKVVEEDVDVAQLFVPFAGRRRRGYTWGPGQDGFVIELRSRLGAHFSYHGAVLDLHDLDKERMPLFSSLFRETRKTFPSDLINLGEARGWYDKNER